MNSSDVIITILGSSGKNTWLRSEIIDILSEELKIEKTEANGRFTAILSRTKYFEKISDAPVKYQFSNIGAARYDAIQKAKEGDQNLRTDIEEFMKIYYWDVFLKCVQDHTEYLDINYEHLVKGLSFIAEGLLGDNPTEYISRLNNAFYEIELPIEDDFRPSASIYNFGDTLQVEDVRTQHIGKFIEVEGRIVDIIIPKSKVLLAAFRCQRCEHITYINQDDRKFVEPYECENSVCRRKGPFKLLDEPESTLVDYQEMVLESLHGGQVVISVAAYGSLCRPPWERDAKVVKVCGIVKKAQCTTRTGKTNLFEWVICKGYHRIRVGKMAPCCWNLGSRKSVCKC